MVFQERQRQIEVQRQHVTSLGGEVRAILESELNASLHLTSGLISYIQARQGKLQASEIDPWLSGLIKQGRHIRNIGIAPGNRITYIYPLAGNEAALGLYYPDNAKQWPAVEQVIRGRRPVLAGPIELKQGGSGLIYRVPVFLEQDQYWGIISTVINADQLLATATTAAVARNLTITLARVDDKGAVQQMIIGNPLQHAQGLAHLQMTTPGNQWLLTANALDKENSLALKRGFGWLLSATLGMLIFLVLNANARRTGMLKALAESQQRFTRAFETAPQGMALLDSQGFCLDANDALCRLLGYTRQALHDIQLPSLIQRDASQPHDGDHLFSDDQPNISQKLCLSHKSGELIDCLLSSAVVEGNPPYRIAQVQDLREQKRLDRMQREFVSTVSHELRTPLTSIAGSLGLIVGGALGETPPAMRQMLDIAHKNCLRLGQLINDLLDMDKLTAGKMQIELRVQSLQPLLQETISSNQPYAEKYGVNFALEGDNQAQVNVDGLRLQQVLANYLSNAAKFSPHGSTVRVKVISTNNQIRVSVQDYGPGIPESFKERIFQKFSQADSSDTRSAGGTGLGLAISKRFIELMGGNVGFESEVGAGSTFWFELPCHRA